RGRGWEAECWPPRGTGAQPMGAPLGGGLSFDRAARKAPRAAPGGERAADRLQQGRLARAVGSENRHCLTRRDVKRDAVEDIDVAEVPGSDLVDLEDVGHCGDSDLTGSGWASCWRATNDSPG